MEKKRVIGFYDYTVLLTYLGLIFAFTGIVRVLNEDYRKGIICLMCAGVCDMFDGAIAATKDRNRYEKHFGIQIDSLCDLVDFGVLPAILTYKIAGGTLIVEIIACAYVLCGLIRLAYFNVQEFERQQETDEKRSTYMGIPITTSAIALPFVYILYSEFIRINTKIFPMILVVLGIGFIAGIEIRKPKKIGKIIMVVFGILELIGVIFLCGAEML